MKKLFFVAMLGIAGVMSAKDAVIPELKVRETSQVEVDSSNLLTVKLPMPLNPNYALCESQCGVEFYMYYPN